MWEDNLFPMITWTLRVTLCTKVMLLADFFGVETSANVSALVPSYFIAFDSTPGLFLPLGFGSLTPLFWLC